MIKELLNHSKPKTLIDINNFFLSSFVTFKQCKIPNKKPSFVSRNNKGIASSFYWYGEDRNGKYIIRLSDHWSKIITSSKSTYKGCNYIKSCFWLLKINTKNNKGIYAGKAYLSKFKAI